MLGLMGNSKWGEEKWKAGERGGMGGGGGSWIDGKVTILTFSTNPKTALWSLEKYDL